MDKKKRPQAASYAKPPPAYCQSKSGPDEPKQTNMMIVKEASVGQSVAM